MFKRIRDPDSLKLFQQETAKFINVELPLEYLGRSRVHAIVSKDNEKIIGGYVIASKGPLRSLEQLPASIISSHTRIGKASGRCFEINGFWLNRDKAPAFSRLFLYLSCYTNIIRLVFEGKFYFVYSYETSKPKLARLYSQFNSVRIYEGQVEALVGMKEAQNEVVEIGSFRRITLAALKHPQFFLKRFRRGGK